MQNLTGDVSPAPIDVIQYGGLEGTPIYTIPFERVQGGQIAVTLEENFAQFATLAVGVARNARYVAAAEVSLWGVTRGQDQLILRDNVRQLTGPLIYVFPAWEAYDAIIVKARNMSGGISGGSFSTYPPVAADEPSQANGAFLRLMIFTQRSRTGGPVAGAHGGG